MDRLLDFAYDGDDSGVLDASETAKRDGDMALRCDALDAMLTRVDADGDGVVSDPTDATSDVVAMQPSWTTTATASADRPSIDVYALGASTQDWEYVTGFGYLDECNGRFGVAPEFPDGIYHYDMTDSLPFGPRCVKGTSMTEEGGPGGGPLPGGGPPA
jgi:hypothetical protein